MCLLIPFASYGAGRPLPESVELRVLAKQEPGDLRVLVRAPLSVIRDASFPVRDDIGHIDLNAVGIILPSAARYWIQRCLQVSEGHDRVTDIEIVKARIAPLSDDSFRSFEQASSYFADTRDDKGANILWDQAWLDIDFKYSTEGGGPLSILPDVANLGAHVTTQLQYLGADQAVHEFAFDGNPGLIYLTPRRLDIGKQFLAHGVGFISKSADVVLFIFCLVLPFRRLREIRYIDLAFAASLSVGFALPAFDLFPSGIWLSPLLATLSALVVLVAGLMNIGGIYPFRRAILTAVAGLVFGASAWFDFAARRQFAGPHSQIAPLAYWAGLLIATQLGIVLLIPLLGGLFKATDKRLELIVVSCLAADAALGWLEERWAQLREVPWHFPVLDARFFALLFAFMAVG
ncbi:MAG: hypothetical protein JOZ60_01670, partial [Verrucomicrobia bacterium]|nr:hypothetical protein [Verrucomicrobiota bacterium]